jgi:hypothetical protein
MWLLTSAESNAIGLHDPKLTGGRAIRQDQDDLTGKREDRCLVLTLGPNNNDAGILGRRVCLNVREIKVERNQNSSFALRFGCERRILASRQVLARDCVCLKPASLRTSAHSRGRFSSIFSFKAYVREEDPPFPRARVRLRSRARPGYLVPEGGDSFSGFQHGVCL